MHSESIILRYLICYPIAIGVSMASIAYLLRFRRVIRWSMPIALLGAAFFLLSRGFLFPPDGHDFRIFYAAGAAVRDGSDPYAAAAMVSPPTALPLFATTSLLPLSVSLTIWAWLTMAMALIIVPLAYAVLRTQSRETLGSLPREFLWLLSATLALSLPVHWDLSLGQVATLETCCILIAMWAQASHRPALAGVALAFATMKPQTMLPFTVLFLRKRDWATWVSLCITVAALCIASGPVASFPGRLKQELANIERLSQEGQTNDFSSAQPHDHAVIGLDRALYCLGLNDRSVIRITQSALLVAMAVMIALWVNRNRADRALLCALVSLYASIFLYHRYYDASILVLPMLYAVTRAFESASRKPVFVAAAMAMLGIFLIHPKVAEVIVEAIPSHFAVLKWLAQAVLLPLTTWFTILTMVLLCHGSRAQQRAPTMEPVSGAAC